MKYNAFFDKNNIPVFQKQKQFLFEQFMDSLTDHFYCTFFLSYVLRQITSINQYSKGIFETFLGLWVAWAQKNQCFRETQKLKLL